MSSFLLGVIILSILMILGGFFLKSGRSLRKELRRLNYIKKAALSFAVKLCSVPPILYIKNAVKKILTLNILSEHERDLIASVIVIIATITGLFTIFLLRDIAKVWYVTILLWLMSMYLPYFFVTVFCDLHRVKINKQMPDLIDEFRSSFIKYQKLRPALLECSQYIDKGLGKLIFYIAESDDITENLENLKVKINNIWFNMFIILLANYKENGGDLISQLYHLNNTMTRYSNIEKKKNKRLIWYEVFIVSTTIFSIPSIILINNLIFGGLNLNMDIDNNILIAKVLFYSCISLIVVRLLRRL